MLCLVSCLFADCLCVDLIEFLFKFSLLFLLMLLFSLYNKSVGKLDLMETILFSDTDFQLTHFSFSVCSDVV